jgi:hypothetical protein
MKSHGSIPNFPRKMVRGPGQDVGKKLVDGFSHPVGRGLAQAASHDHTFPRAAQAHDVAVPGEVPGGGRAHLGARRDKSKSSSVTVGLQLKCPFRVAHAAGPRQDRDEPRNEGKLLLSQFPQPRSGQLPAATGRQIVLRATQRVPADSRARPVAARAFRPEGGGGRPLGPRNASRSL